MAKASMTNAAFIQRMLDDAFATLDYRALAAHLAEGVVFETFRAHGRLLATGSVPMVAVPTIRAGWRSVFRPAQQQAAE